jgi:hypothetical protein
MDKLSKAQKDEYATAFAILALYDGEVSDRCVSPRKEKAWALVRSTYNFTVAGRRPPSS